MKNELTVLKGCVLFAPESDRLEWLEQGYIVAENGSVAGVYRELPERYAKAPVSDTNGIITPGFCDLHLHAPQYPMLGMGMDLTLLDWLKSYTFKTEAMFSDVEFAKRAYARLAAELINVGTTRVCAFSSLHTEATLALMAAFEAAGVTGFVGKVNMDRNGGENLQEDTEDSKRETLRWLEQCGQFSAVRPMITPRFTPSCTDGLMEWLGKLANGKTLPVQSHLSENSGEISWVRELHPDCEYYWQTYDKYGMWKQDTLMAHCVFSDESERAAMIRAGVTAVHCPDSNINIVTDIAPVRRMLQEGVKVALGSDIAGGAVLSMLGVAAQAVRASKVRWYRNPQEAFLNATEAFYLATTAGAAYFGAEPGFPLGQPLHAVVFSEEGMPPAGRSLTPAERVERLLYLGGNSITRVYSEGKRVK